MSLILKRSDLEFLLFDWLDVASLCARPRFSDHSAATFCAALDAAEAIAQDKFATHNKLGDQKEPVFDNGAVRLIPEIGVAVQAFIDAGFLTAAFDSDLGGMQLPYVVERACMAYFMGANAATSGYPFLTMANASCLLVHGSREQRRRYAEPLLQGRFFGTMCLSEPQAGSSLADIRTRAEPQPDGSFRLYGSKMWISAGDHELGENIIHLVLARIVGAPAGTRGISLFVAPKYLVDADGRVGARNDISLAGLNHKMGMRATTNCLLMFGDGEHPADGRAGAWAERVGEPGQGLAAMFHMMNEARIGVGLSAAMLGYTGYLHALDYARSRPQGRPIGNRDPSGPAVAIIEHADVRRMLLRQKTYVEGGLALCLYCAKLVDERVTALDEPSRKRAELLLEVLTPIAKSWPSQWCLAANDLAIQVHGGYGYTRDYNVEQFYRDNRLNPIHEGTHGIQAIDLLGRKVRMSGGAAYAALLATMASDASDLATAVDDALHQHARQLQQALSMLDTVTSRILDSQPLDRSLANASPYLEAFGHVVVAWIWLTLERTAIDADASRMAPTAREGKRAAAHYFFTWELPQAMQLFEGVGSMDTTAMDLAAACF